MGTNKSVLQELVDLENQQRQLQAAIAEKRQQARSEFVAKVYSEMTAAGFSTDDLVAALRSQERSQGKRGGQKGEPKYRHPTNADVTWSGKGKRPGWIKDWLAANKDINDLAIKG